MPRRFTEPLTSLSVLGSDPKDPELWPKVDEQEQPVLEDGEEVVYQGRHPMRISVWDTKAFRPVFDPKKQAVVMLTNRRLIAVFPQWRSDPGLGSLFERRVAGTLMEREEGKQVLCCHVRFPWVGRARVYNAKGMLSQSRPIEVHLISPTYLFAVKLLKFDPDEAETIVRTLVAEEAGNRLSHQDEIDHGKTEEERADNLRQLTALSDGSARAETFSWGYGYDLPGYRKIADPPF